MEKKMETHKDKGEQRVHIWLSKPFVKKLERFTADGGEFEDCSRSEMIRILAERGMEKPDNTNDKFKLLNDCDQSRADILHDMIQTTSEEIDSLIREIINQQKIADTGITRMLNDFHMFVRIAVVCAVIGGILLAFCVILLAFLLSYAYGI